MSFDFLVPELRLTKCPPVHPRHHQVQQNEVVQTALAKHLERHEAIGRMRCAVPRHLQDFADGFAEVDIVLDDENPWRGVIASNTRIGTPCGVFATRNHGNSSQSVQANG